MIQSSDKPSGRRLALVTTASLLGAIVIVIGVVLPAEYGIDPLGTGNAFGLMGLSRIQPITPEDTQYKTDVLEFELAPTEWAESTYRMVEGASMLFSWEATGPVSFNFHSAPDGAPAGYAESFDTKEVEQAHGSYMAPFSGIHGWYWENLGSGYVTIRLTTAGFYSEAQQARARVTGLRPLRDARGELLNHPEE